MTDKITRRHLFAQAGGVGIGIMIAPASASASQSASVSKGAAIYRLANSPKQRCSDCRLFLPAPSIGLSRCRVVGGPIEPGGVCVLWERGTAAAPRGSSL